MLPLERNERTSTRPQVGSTDDLRFIEYVERDGRLTYLLDRQTKRFYIAASRWREVRYLLDLCFGMD